MFKIPLIYHEFTMFGSGVACCVPGKTLGRGLIQGTEHDHALRSGVIYVGLQATMAYY